MNKKCHKILIDKVKFRNTVSAASSLLCDLVGTTLGPNGLTVLIKQEDGKSPKITKDGVTVSDSIFLVDSALDTIVQAIKEAAKKTNSEAGDGTTTAIVLTHGIIKEALKFIETDSVSPQELSRSLKCYGNFLADSVNDFSIPVETEDKMKHVALISSNGDEEVARSIIEALSKSGDFGIVTVEDGYGSNIEVQHVEGFHMKGAGFHKLGVKGPSLINFPEKQAIEYKSPAIVVYDGHFNEPLHLIPFWSALTSQGKNSIPLVILAHGFGDSVMEAIALSKAAGTAIVPIVSPVYSSANTIRLFLEDFATWAGCRVLDANPKTISSIISPDGKIDLGYLGSCEKVTMQRDITLCYGGKGDSDEILLRVKALKTLQEVASSPYERDIFEHRLAMLTGGVVHIIVGGESKLEMRERKDRVVDALSAVRAAISMGVVPGGGTILQGLITRLDEDEDQSSLALITKKIFSKALSYPLRQLAANAGMSPDVIQSQLIAHLEKCPYGGWDMRSQKLIDDMIVGGIIDPAKVTYCAIKNATSIATELLCGGGMVSFDEDVALEHQDIQGMYLNE